MLDILSPRLGPANLLISIIITEPIAELMPGLAH